MILEAFGNAIEGLVPDLTVISPGLEAETLELAFRQRQELKDPRPRALAVGTDEANPRGTRQAREAHVPVVVERRQPPLPRIAVPGAVGGQPGARPAHPRP